MKVDIERIKFMISEMMNKENDAHAKLLQEIQARIGLKSDLEGELNIVYSTKITLLEEIYRKLQNI